MKITRVQMVAALAFAAGMGAVALSSRAPERGGGPVASRAVIAQALMADTNGVLISHGDVVLTNGASLADSAALAGSAVQPAALNLVQTNEYIGTVWAGARYLISQQNTSPSLSYEGNGGAWNVDGAPQFRQAIGLGTAATNSQNAFAGYSDLAALAWYTGFSSATNQRLSEWDPPAGHLEYNPASEVVFIVPEVLPDLCNWPTLPAGFSLRLSDDPNSFESLPPPNVGCFYYLTSNTTNVPEGQVDAVLARYVALMADGFVPERVDLTGCQAPSRSGYTNALALRNADVTVQVNVPIEDGGWRELPYDGTRVALNATTAQLGDCCYGVGELFVRFPTNTAAYASFELGLITFSAQVSNEWKQISTVAMEENGEIVSATSEVIFAWQVYPLYDTESGNIGCKGSLWGDSAWLKINNLELQ